MSIHPGEVKHWGAGHSSGRKQPATPDGPGASTQMVAHPAVAKRRRHVRVGMKRLGVVLLLAGVVALAVNDLGARGHVSNANHEIARLTNANHELSSLQATVASDRSQLASDNATVTTTKAALAAQTSAASSLKSQLQAETRQVAQVKAQLAQANQKAAVASQQAQAARQQLQAAGQPLAQLRAWQTSSFTPAVEQLTSDMHAITSDIQTGGPQGAPTESDGKLMAQHASADISSSVAPNAGVEAAWKTWLQQNVAEGQAIAAGTGPKAPGPNQLPLEQAMEAAGLTV